MPRKAPARKNRRAKRVVPRRLLLSVSLRHVKPAVWRELSVSDQYSLSQLHRAIQMAFGWLDCHLFEFQIGGRRFEQPHQEASGEDASTTILANFALDRGAAFQYVYDFGDYWEHDVVVKEVAGIEPDDMPEFIALLVDGARACPPEDAGGPGGYEDVLEALRNPSAAEPELLSWIEKDFDPARFDLRTARHALILASAWGAI